MKTYRMGAPRQAGEGLRLGTVRFPPRGIRKQDYKRLGYYDVWLPVLAPSRDLVNRYKHGKISWAQFRKHYAREMDKPEPRQFIQLLAELSKQANFSIGCYCENESECHRSILFQLIQEASSKTPKSGTRSRTAR